MSKHETPHVEAQEGGCCAPAQGEAGERRPGPRLADVPQGGQDDGCCGGHGAAEPAPQTQQRRSGGCGCH